MKTVDILVEPITVFFPLCMCVSIDSINKIGIMLFVLYPVF